MDFRLCESLKKAHSRTFCSLKLSLESWILHCLCKKFPEYPPDITIGIWLIACLIPKHFSWFFKKNYSQIYSWHFFCLCQNDKCFCRMVITCGISWNLLELNLLLENHSWKLINYKKLLESLWKNLNQLYVHDKKLQILSQNFLQDNYLAELIRRCQILVSLVINVF